MQVGDTLNSNILIEINKEYIRTRPAHGQYILLNLVYLGFALVGFVDFYLVVGLGQLVPFFAVYTLFYTENQARATFSEEDSGLSPKNRVTIRYLLSLFLSLITVVAHLAFFFILQDFFPISLIFYLSTTVFFVNLGIFLASLAFPLNYALGSSKSKPWFYLLILSCFSLFLLWKRGFPHFFQESFWREAPGTLVEVLPKLLLSLVSSLFFFGLSCCLSQKIYLRNIKNSSCTMDKNML